MVALKSGVCGVYPAGMARNVPLGGRPQILVVSQDKEFQGQSARILAGLCDLVAAHRPDEALQAARGGAFDVLLIDIRVATDAWRPLNTWLGDHPDVARVCVAEPAELARLQPHLGMFFGHRFAPWPLSESTLMPILRDVVLPPWGRRRSCLIISRATPALSEALARDLSALDHGWFDATGVDGIPANAHPDVAVLLDPTLATELKTTVPLLSLQGSPVPLLVATESAGWNAVHVARSEGDDMIWAPVRLEELFARAKVLVLRAESQADLSRWATGVEASGDAPALVGKSPAIHKVFEFIRRVSSVASTVLIRGETGTGKELVARAIHAASPLRKEPFVALSIAELPPTLLESELFGYEAGAFTGARRSKPGWFEAADGGVLFLDEIGDLPLELQTKLLRVFQERKYSRLGSTRLRDANFRLLCATNRNLEQMVEEGRFRGDLYYRINVVAIELPPLRERAGDIPLLAQFFLTAYASRAGRKNVRLSEAAVRELCAHSWPGNVRELQHAIERVVTLAHDGEEIADGIVVARLPRQHLHKLSRDLLDAGRSLFELLDDIEKRVLAEVMERFQGNQSAAAAKLRIPRTTLRSRLRKQGLVD